MMELTIIDINGRTQFVNVLPNTTIGELKQCIAPHFEARPSQVKLSTRNGQILHNDQNTVSEYGLSSGSTVMVLISMTPEPLQVFVKNEKGQVKPYDITEDETVDQLMTKIRQNEGIPENQQRLIYNGLQLDCGRKLQDYKVVPGGTIYMTLRLRGG